MYVIKLLLNGWTDLNEIFCMRLGGTLDGLDSQMSPADGAVDGIKAIYLYCN